MIDWIKIHQTKFILLINVDDWIVNRCPCCYNWHALPAYLHQIPEWKVTLDGGSKETGAPGICPRDWYSKLTMLAGMWRTQPPCVNTSVYAQEAVWQSLGPHSSGTKQCDSGYITHRSLQMCFPEPMNEYPFHAWLLSWLVHCSCREIFVLRSLRWISSKLKNHYIWMEVSCWGEHTIPFFLRTRWYWTYCNRGITLHIQTLWVSEDALIPVKR